MEISVFRVGFLFNLNFFILVCLFQNVQICHMRENRVFDKTNVWVLETKHTMHVFFKIMFSDVWREEQEKILQQRIAEMELELAKEKKKVDVSVHVATDLIFGFFLF